MLDLETQQSDTALSIVADIFVSYDHSDRIHAEKLAQSLEALGWSVFWDYKIRTAEDFEERILGELASASCVIVLWSKKSIRSEWVFREARIGLERKRMLPVTIENVRLPEEFQRLNVVHLPEGKFDVSDFEFKKLRGDVARLIGGEPLKSAAFETALKNIAHYGDTDVLPFPLEKQIFSAMPAEAHELLQRIDTKFDEFFVQLEPYYEASLHPVGFFGYRWVTQIDPIWNAYFLGLVASVGSKIERERVPPADNTVFSYRFNPSSDPPGLFDQAIGYLEYQRWSLEQASNFQYVVVCDIADFYQRISHVRLEHALEEVGAERETSARILQLLDFFSRGTGSGLPVGGPAARLLSELMLNSVDYLLRTSGITFCRFADDYHIFADSEQQAYAHLMFLSSKLFAGQGLTLQKSKTRIMSAKEFIATSAFAAPAPKKDSTAGQSKINDDLEGTFFRLRIKFDPYGANSVAEYKKIRAQIEDLDIEGTLVRELAKSRVDPALFRRLVSTIRFLPVESQISLVQALLESLPILYPLLSHVFRAFRDSIESLNDKTRHDVFDKLRGLMKTRSYLMGVPAHLAYAVRVLAHDPAPETDAVLNTVFDYSQSLVRRDVILAMAKRGCRDWIRNLTTMNLTQFPWEKRALLVGSYILQRAGQSWRLQQSARLSQFDRLVMEWAEQTVKGKSSDIPI